MRVQVLAAVVLISTTHAQARTQCATRDAVYRAVASAKGFAPDTLYLHRDIPGQQNYLGFALIRSPELGTDIPLAWFVTSGSGQTGVTGTFPIEKVRASRQLFYEGLKSSGTNDIDISSVSVAIYADYRAERFPDPKGPPPRLVVFPEFLREYRALSAGMVNGVFKLDRCGKGASR
jgi:hypothetical protein